jgi:hypothetical protein
MDDSSIPTVPTDKQKFSRDENKLIKEGIGIIFGIQCLLYCTITGDFEAEAALRHTVIPP